jgi:hypothetical protein
VTAAGAPKKFADAVRTMRRHDPQAAEDAFGWLSERAGEYVEELAAEFRADKDHHGLRCWLLELIGEARSPLALPLLTEQLDSDDEALRYWAVQGLSKLDSAPARQVLWRARANGRID